MPRRVPIRVLKQIYELGVSKRIMELNAGNGIVGARLSEFVMTLGFKGLDIRSRPFNFSASWKLDRALLRKWPQLSKHPAQIRLPDRGLP
jgi:hypothetical protein